MNCLGCSADLSEYFNNPVYCDVRLYTKQRVLHASSLLLSQHSAVLKRHILEEKDIFLDCFLDEEDEMEMLISSLYNRTNLVVSRENVFTVAKFGLVYQVTWLTEEAYRWVKANITYGNCVALSCAGYKLRDNHRYADVAEECAHFLQSTIYLEEVVMELEMILEDDLFLTLPCFFLVALLQNPLRRDECRVVELVQRWLTQDSNLIQAMSLLPLLQLSQLYLVNKDLHASFFEHLVSSDKLTADDRKKILELSALSILECANCIVTGVGFSKEMPKVSSLDIRDFLASDTWTACSFEDIVMVKQFPGVTEFQHLEIFLVWSEHNPASEYQVKAILGAVDLEKVNQEYMADVLAHLRNHTCYTDTFAADLEARIVARDYATKPGKVREFSNYRLTAGNLKSLKLKKHTVTRRPCNVAGCVEKTLGFLEVKLKKDTLPLYKVLKTNFTPTVLEHCHNGDVAHIYFVVEEAMVSCFTGTWAQMEGLVQPTMKVVCTDKKY